MTIVARLADGTFLMRPEGFTERQARRARQERDDRASRMSVWRPTARAAEFDDRVRRYSALVGTARGPQPAA